MSTKSDCRHNPGLARSLVACEHITRERTTGVAPAHSEKFAYVCVTDDNLESCHAIPCHLRTDLKAYKRRKNPTTSVKVTQMSAAFGGACRQVMALNSFVRTLALNDTATCMKAWAACEWEKAVRSWLRLGGR
jgi:hypothetical protein